MQGIAQAFIDEFRPGDNIPDGRYELEHWAAMVERGVVMPPAATTPKPDAQPKRQRKAE